jgi:alanyl-tRNA synthetase
LRKVMLLAAVMAMVLAAAAPAFAQATAVGGSVQYVDCDQIQAAATGQYNVENNQEDLAALAQELGVDQNQVLACLGSIAAGRDVNINASASASAMTVTAKATSTASASAGGGGGGGGSASAAAGGALPSTGGASLLALGAGVLLVAGGLLARRIFR